MAMLLIGAFNFVESICVRAAIGEMFRVSGYGQCKKSGSDKHVYSVCQPFGYMHLFSIPASYGSSETTALTCFLLFERLLARPRCTPSTQIETF
jgi:hypothetical protein